nr:hypothetical protein [uncultured Flavobacterium sp.]
MTNAKQELLNAVKDTAKIKCASIRYGRREDEATPKTLKLNYSENEYNEFLNLLDFEYDSGYGGQELYGTVWLEDGTWLSRGEYDGSEWWEHNVLPDVPAECL